MSPTDPLAVESVETTVVRIPLPRPLPVGVQVIDHREYTVVRVRTKDGVSGKAYCLSRNAPMSAIVERLLAPLVVGHGSDDPPRAWESMLRGSATVGRVGLVRRAIGLVDIALWDIAAQRARQPLWALLGHSADPRPTMMIAAYLSPHRSLARTVDDIVSAATAGYTRIKITRSPDCTVMRELFVRLGRELPDDVHLVVDANFGWRSAGDAISDIGRWAAPELAWLEDPLLPEDVDGCIRIRRQAGQRLGVGDEVTDPRLLAELSARGAIDVLRLDVVAIGGITPALDVLARSRDAGLPVSCHVYPEVTVHLNADVETFDRSPGGNDLDPAPTVISDGPAFENGFAIPPQGPGLGFDVDPALNDSAIVLSDSG